MMISMDREYNIHSMHNGGRGGERGGGGGGGGGGRAWVMGGADGVAMYIYAVSIPQ